MQLHSCHSRFLTGCFHFCRLLKAALLSCSSGSRHSTSPTSPFLARLLISAVCVRRQTRGITRAQTYAVIASSFPPWAPSSTRPWGFWSTPRLQLTPVMISGFISSFFLFLFLLWWIETPTTSPQLRHFSVFSPVHQIVCGHTRPTPVSALSLWAHSVKVWHSTTRVWLGYNWKMTPNGPKFQPSVSWAMTAGVTGQYSSGSLTVDCQRKSNSMEQKWETCVAIEMNTDGCHHLTAQWPWVKSTFAPESRLPGRARV